ncbi:MAG TPA: hypothetical protein VMW50_13660 [Dehalococcoidia bacterium]|nr:hypothetical protein [Dehalococcoidia bacterium]
MKRWKIVKHVFGDKIEYSLFDTKLNITVQISLTNWMLPDVFTTVGGIDKIEFENDDVEREVLEFMEWEKNRRRTGL